MSSRNVTPKWWQLYLIFPLLIVLFAVDSWLKLSTGGHQAVQIGIVLIVFGLLHLWLRANAIALSEMDQRQYHRTITVIRIPPYQLPDTTGNKQPMLQFPNSELKDILSDTVEMDSIDAEFLPVDGTAEDVKKEYK